MMSLSASLFCSQRRSALSLVAFLTLGVVACSAPAEDDADEGDTAAVGQNIEARGPLLWTKVFPTNPNGTPAEETVVDSVKLAGCKYSSVIHVQTYMRQVGIKVEALAPGSCAVTTAIGGTGYLSQATYPGPTAHARLAKYGPLGRLVFTSNGSSGPFGSAQGTMPVLTVKLIAATTGATLRATTQSVCAPGPGGQIVPTGAVTVDSSGLLSISGTKSASTGLPGDGTCPGPGVFYNYTLLYTGFATGAGPVPTPTIQ